MGTMLGAVASTGSVIVLKLVTEEEEDGAYSLSFKTVAKVKAK